MKKQPFYFIYSLGGLGGAFLMSQCTTVEKQKPNIVIILADDLGWADVGYHGGAFSTPNIDQLAEKGIRLERFYTAPISSPTRAGLMTGRFPSRLGIRKAVIPPWRAYGLDETEETLADVLRDAGYAQRAIIGKWHLGHSRRAYYPLNRGFTYFYGHLNGALNYFTHIREGELDWHKNWDSCYDEGYTTDLLTNEAVKFIGQQSTDSPFLLYVAYNAPHSPFQAHPEDIAVYAANPAFAKDKDHLTEEELMRCTYAAMITCLDRGIGKITQELERTGQLDNTILLFFSDNGPAPGSPGLALPLRGEKSQEWDGGVRVPAIMLWKKGFKQPGISDQVTGYIDVLPTIREIIGVKAPPKKELDGISIYPVLKGDRKTIERDLYLGRSVIVNQDYKLLLPNDNPSMKDLTEAYFVSFKDDPYEARNSKEANVKEKARLKKLVLAYDALPQIQEEIDYETGRESFVAPPEWKVTKP